MLTTFVGGQLCINGELVDGSLTVDDTTGLIEKIDLIPTTRSLAIEDDVVNIAGKVIAPGFIELQTNGVHGFHFTHFEDAQSYESKLEQTARYYATQGVTAFYPTIPTVTSEDFKKILPHLRPREVEGGASILGAHCEGPYLHPNKKGAHNAALFQSPATPVEQVYAKLDSIGIVTLAPELPDSASLISKLVHNNIRVSLGHSNATYAEALVGLEAGATCITHLFNAMSGLHHRDPGLPGLVGLPLKRDNYKPSAPYFSIIPDGHHVHPNVVSMMFRSAPQRTILVSDSIELLGLPDGIYPGHAQIPQNQVKEGTRVTIDGTDTLVGGCCSLQEGIRNLMAWTGCNVSEVALTLTENVVGLMGLQDRAKLQLGWKADFNILKPDGTLESTWIKGRKVYTRS